MTTQGYAIFKNGKRTVRRTFDTYEQARQHVRKLIRKMGADTYNAKLPADAYIGWDNISRNPTQYGILGYEVRRVAGLKLPTATLKIKLAQ